MSEYTEVERPFLDQLETLGWRSIDQGCHTIPTDPALSLRDSFRQWLLPEVFRDAVRAINLTAGGKSWLTDNQLAMLRDQLLRQPNRTLLEANEAIQALLFKTQVVVNELTGEQDPVVKLIDFARPENNVFHAFPNATRIAFTGTPLITKRHGDKKTHKRFGEYIDTYRLLDAVKDGATLQILYEGKTADTALNEKHEFDTKFEDLFGDRSEEELRTPNRLDSVAIRRWIRLGALHKHCFILCGDIFNLL